MKMNRILKLGMALGLMSCVKEMKLKTTGTVERKPVFHLFIEPDSAVSASLFHVEAISDPILPDNTGDIVLYRNGNAFGPLANDGHGNYTYPSLKYSAGDSFRVKVSDGLNLFQVAGKVPSKLVFNKVDTATLIVPGFGPAFNITLEFKDSAVYDNYYRLYLKKKYYLYTVNANGDRIDSTLKTLTIPIYGAETPFFQNNFNNYTSNEILFPDATFNGTAVKFRFYTSASLAETRQIKVLSLEVFLENMEKSLYDYYNTRNAHLWQQQSITQLPGTIEGNIPNGYGVAGAFTHLRKVINLR